MKYDILETKERISADNEKVAEETRKLLKEKKVFFVNLMASPGAGKTTLLTQVIKHLKDKYRIGVMEADVDSDVDAKTISDLGIKVIQLHSAGLCHMDADMTYRGLEQFGMDDVDIIFLENIGNLVCPAEFDVGASKKVMILSVPEGDDKPLKYPLMFQVSDICLINKIDAKEVFDFDEERFIKNAHQQNPSLTIIPVSALTGEGIQAFIDWLEKEIEEWRK